MGDQNTDARTGPQIKGRQRRALLHLSYLPNLCRWMCQQPSNQTPSEHKHGDQSEREIYLLSLSLQKYTAQIRELRAKGVNKLNQIKPRQCSALERSEDTLFFLSTQSLSTTSVHYVPLSWKRTWTCFSRNVCLVNTHLKALAEFQQST